MTSRSVWLGSCVAVAGAVHSLVNARRLRRPRTTATAPAVPVLVPARNEADRIDALLRSCVGQPGVLEVIVLDDGSDDATAAIAAAAGARVVRGSNLLPGWLGKPWACTQLTDAADPTADTLVFVDADVRLEPGAVPAAVALLHESGLDVMCPFPRQIAGTPVERLLQPLLQWSILTTLPLRLAERSAWPSLTAACGQFVVLRRSALERAGGFAAVRGDVLDDLALVRAVKAAGGRGGVVDGSAVASCRMYEGWGDVRAGYGKSLWTAFGSPSGAAAVVGVLLLTYVAPALAMLRGSRVGAVGYLAGVLSRVVAARATGSPPWPDALAHPASIALFGALTVDSLCRHRWGELTWRGRPIRLHSPQVGRAQAS